MIQTYGSFKDSENLKDKPAAERMQFSALRYVGSKAGDDAPTFLPNDAGIEFSVSEDDGIYILLDLQKETVGLLDLDIEIKENADILIGFGEHIDDLRVRTTIGGRLFGAEYKAKAGRQSFTHYFKRFGCRYIQLHIYAPYIKIYYAGIRPTDYPVEDVPFDTGDYLLNKIYDTSLYTLKMCMHEHYEDCPWREQALYAMDSRIQMLCGYYGFGEKDMPRSSLDLLSKGIREDGFLDLCAPAEFERTIPSFCLAYIGAMKDYLEHSGDIEFAKSKLPILEGILKCFYSQLDENGLLHHFIGEGYWNFYEWSEGLTNYEDSVDDGLFAPMQAMFIMAAEQYIDICKILGRELFDSELNLKIEKMRKASQVFWNSDRQYFATALDRDLPDSELVGALMVLSGIANDEQRDIILGKLANPQKSGLSSVTLSYSIYKYDAIMSKGSEYSSFVKDDIAKIWGDMLYKGATTFWETAKGAWDFYSAGSLCHGWSAVPVYIFHKYKKELFGK